MKHKIFFYFAWPLVAIVFGVLFLNNPNIWLQRFGLILFFSGFSLPPAYFLIKRTN